MKTKFTQRGITKQGGQKVKGQISVVVTTRLLNQVQKRNLEAGINV